MIWLAFWFLWPLCECASSLRACTRIAGCGGGGVQCVGLFIPGLAASMATNLGSSISSEMSPPFVQFTSSAPLQATRAAPFACRELAAWLCVQGESLAAEKRTQWRANGGGGLLLVDNAVFVSSPPCVLLRFCCLLTSFSSSQGSAETTEAVPPPPEPDHLAEMVQEDQRRVGKVPQDRWGGAGSGGGGAGSEAMAARRRDLHRRLDVSSGKSDTC
jgi:hypothetical protein